MSARIDSGRRATSSGQLAAESSTASPQDRRLGPALAVIATAQLMVVLDATIVNVALPHIQRALGFSGTGLEWVRGLPGLSWAVVKGISRSSAVVRQSAG